MKLIAISVFWLVLATSVLFVPISFSVDGFGLVVNPGGVKTVRARESGIVYHYPASEQEFVAGQIVSAVMRVESAAENTFLMGSLRRDLAKIDSDLLEKTSKVLVDLERDGAKMDASKVRLQARLSLTRDMEQALVELKKFTQLSDADIDSLNAERLSQLDKLEALLRKSGQNSALPAQKLAAMLDGVQTSRLAVISSKGTQFVSERMVLDLVKDLTELQFSNSIDEAEVDILFGKVAASEQQLEELTKLKTALRDEANARYLARLKLPQVMVAGGSALDMRMLQPSRAEVSKGDALRILSEREPAQGLLITVFGSFKEATVTLVLNESACAISLLNDVTQTKAALSECGIPVLDVSRDREIVGDFEVATLFVAYDNPDVSALKVADSSALSADQFPVSVTHEFLRRIEPVSSDGAEYSNTIIGFLENRHSVSLRPNQVVKGTIYDLENGEEIEFGGKLQGRDFSTVDTKELGIRLGNQSLAAKIIARGVLSQVTVKIDDPANENVQKLAGSVVHLSFPLGNRSLFSFLWANDAAI